MGFNVTDPCPQSVQGYILDVIDYFIGKCWSFSFCTKAEAYGAAKALIPKMENANRTPELIEVYQSDHGGEVIASTEFRAWLDEQGISCRTAPMWTPTYNSAVEQQIQTKNNSTKTFLKQHALPRENNEIM